MINFFTGNHGNAVHVEDTFEYVFQGLKSIGVNIRYSRDWFIGNVINLVMEGDVHSFSDGMISIKKENPKTKIYLIVTEILGPDGIFNSANALPEEWDKTQPYQIRAKWVYRSKQFHKLVPFVDGFIASAEPLIPGYHKLGGRFHYLPLAPIPGYRPIDFLDYNSRDIDFIFTGTETKYRTGLLNALKGYGYKIISLDGQTPAYLRRHFLSRARISLGMKLSDNTVFMSKQRAHYHLNNLIPHVFERTPDESDLHEFINFAETGADFLDACRQSLDNFDKVALGNFEEFFVSKKFNYSHIFQHLKAFLYE